ncbi:MAG: hypothetical protein WAZ14_03210 [Patescibacteria group bacterium]
MVSMPDKFTPATPEWQVRIRALVKKYQTEIAKTHPITNDWQWNVNDYGYLGVNIQANGTLVWYDHRHNTLDGNAWGAEQPIQDFLDNGPKYPNLDVPEEVLAQVYAKGLAQRG